MTFWQGKKVFITGHTGFKGSWLTMLLKSLGAELTGFSLPPPASNTLFTTANVAQDIQNHFGDIRDASLLHSIMNEAQPEIVFHLAAQSLVRYSYQHPLETYATNVMGTVNLLEAARHITAIKVIVNVTSDKCYKNKEQERGYEEEDSLGGHDPYSSSKACAELISHAYRCSYYNNTTVALATARGGNIIGGGDWAPDRLIPDIMRSYINNTPVIIRYPHAVRPWQYVLDPLRGYLLLAEQLYRQKNAVSESWNFGPAADEVKPVRWITEYLTSHLNANNGWKIETSDQAHETSLLQLNSAKAEKWLGWKPLYKLTQALEETANWYQAYLTGKAMREFSLEQIKKYYCLV